MFISCVKYFINSCNKEEHRIQINVNIFQFTIKLGILIQNRAPLQNIIHEIQILKEIDKTKLLQIKNNVI